MSLTAGGLTALGLSSPAQAAVTAPIDCPTALPTASAVDGLTGTGFTVEKGTKPDPFTATVVGQLTDGIAPGVNLIVAELSSPAITRAGGSWAGISGSPVYTSDGKLIGSVSYGFASASNIAGITPGPDITKLYGASSTSAKARKKVAVPDALAKKITATGAVTAAAVKGGFTAMPIPITVSGLSNLRDTKRLAKLGKKLGGVTVLSGGYAGSGQAEDPDAISAGSNFAAAYSYGDVTLGGVGTTTTVCNGTAIAFGHPFDTRNKTQLSAHSASSVLIQPDPVFGPYKLANIGGVVGVVDRDLTTGIRAKLGATPSVFPITTSISEDGDAPVNGKTVGVLQQVAPDIASMHLLSQIDRQGGYWEGSAKLTFVVTGTRAGGVPFKVTLTDHYSDTYWMGAVAADALANVVSSLQTQPYEPVQITGVDITGSVTQTYKQWRVNNVRQWKNGAWSTSKTISTKPGAKIKVRLSLSKFKSEDVVYKTFTLTVPKKSSGASGTLVVSAGGFDEFGDFSTAAVKGTKFNALLKSLSTPVYDSMSVSLNLSPTVKKPVEARSSANAPIESYEKDYDVNVK